jgi:hypothetical protein
MGAALAVGTDLAVTGAHHFGSQALSRGMLKASHKMGRMTPADKLRYTPYLAARMSTEEPTMEEMLAQIIRNRSE